MKVAEIRQLALWPLVDYYDHEKHQLARKEKAELAFGIALAIQDASDKMGPGFRDKKREYTENARAYAHECITTLEGLTVDTLEETAAVFTVLAGISLPNYFHIGTVLPRLSALL